MNHTKANTHQPPPQDGKEDVIDCVLQDLQDRAAAGKEKYGTLLQTHNGRDALIDAYQEALDLVMYLKAFIYMFHLHSTNFLVDILS